MKKQLKKVFVTFVAALTVGSAVAPLATSFAQEPELVPEYKATYAVDPTTLDYTFSMRDINTMHAINFIDGLYENDQYGNYIPAVAESHEVSEDGLTYTYKIRQGVKWSDNNGNEWGEVTAHDFVTGLQHAADAQSEMLPIVQNSIDGLDDYVNGKITDFAEVGVKAVDDYTLQYTLTRPEPYFNSKTTYGILYPINQEFLDSAGESFGSLSPDSILYNGPFLLSNFTAKSIIEYTKNPNYWDPDNVFLDTVSFTYNDGSDSEVFYRLFEDGAVSFFGVDPTLPIYDEIKEKYDGQITTSQIQGSTFMLQFNLDRMKHEATGKTDDAQHESTNKAILNKKFRQALMFGFDRVTYLSQQQGAEFAANVVRNTLVPPAYVNLDQETFGEAVLRHLQEMDPELYGDVSLEDGQDGFFNKEKAQKLMAEAKEELEAEGVQFPIQLDLPVNETNASFVNMAKSLKACYEEVFGEDVVVNPVLLNLDSYLAATFNATVAEEVDYDFTNESGWIPDYLDPSTFLDIYHPENGTFLIPIGFNPLLVDGQDDPQAEAREKAGLWDYGKLVDEANGITDDQTKRFDKFAEAQAWLTDAAFAIPVRAGGGNLRVTKIVPFSGPFPYAGPMGRMKFLKVQKDIVTYEQWEKALEEWKSKLNTTSSGSSEEKAESKEDESEASEESKEDSEEASKEEKESEKTDTEEASEETAETEEKAE